VFVDGELQFDSGVMKQASPAKPVSIDVTGKREMRLVVADAGDGIICDCADWLEARLTRSAQPARLSPTEVLDIAPFAEGLRRTRHAWRAASRTGSRSFARKTFTWIRPCGRTPTAFTW